MKVQRLAAILVLDIVGYSARMAEDRAAALADAQRVLSGTVRPEIRNRGGRIVKLTGDGAVAAFASASAAIGAAVAIQRGLRGDPLTLRAGVHAGDVIERDGDLFGEALNVAARLEAAAEPGGALVSQLAAELAGPAACAGFRPAGPLRLHNVRQPIETLALDLERQGAEAEYARLAGAQQIRFARSRDGTRLAWTAVGEGAPIVKAPNWVQHLERDWDMPNAQSLALLASLGRLVRFDSRGNGLSDPEPGPITLESLTDDLEAVFDAAGIERAPVYALSQGCAVAISFAVRRPERVSALVLWGSFAMGRAIRPDPLAREVAQALNAMARVGWHAEYPSVRDHFAQMIYPDLAPADQRAFAEIMRAAITPENFVATREGVDGLDVRDRLGAVACPTLVLHARDEQVHPIAQGQMVASGIPGARFVALPSRSHLLSRFDPAWPQAAEEIRRFLAHPAEAP